jgi:tight adherence protein B
MDRLLTQLPEAFDTISRMMRAGRTFPQAMQATAENGSPPLAGEFGYCCDQQQLGMPPDAALRDLARRTGLLEVKIFVLAVSIHRQSGGNLAELLEKLADVIRARQQIRGLISTLTVEGRFQIYVLSALPVLAFAVMAYFNPANTQELLDRPWIMAATIVAMVLGWIWMNRIVNFSY